MRVLIHYQFSHTAIIHQNETILLGSINHLVSVVKSGQVGSDSGITWVEICFSESFPGTTTCQSVHKEPMPVHRLCLHKDCVTGSWL